MEKAGASAKHLDFHLQREKALTKELEGKCKALQAQIAQLEQDKAELRREKIALSDEIKRTSKLDERVHFLQKENEHKDELLELERTKVADAVSETERVHSKASASIAAWTEAERQWIAEQEALNAEITELRASLDRVTSEHAALGQNHQDITSALHKKEQQCDKLEANVAKLEADVTSLHAQLEKSQNKVFDLEQAIYRLDLAGVKQKEALSLKDTEINALEAKIAQHELNEEKLEQAVSSLSDRINAAKMMDLQGKGEKEKLFCDFADAQKENQRLIMQIEALKRDVALANQTQSNMQSVIDELRTKCTSQLEEIKERSVQLRKDELTISQLQMDLNKLQSQRDEWEFRYSSLEGELREAQTLSSKQLAQLEDERQAQHKLQVEIQELQSQVDAKEEALVVAHADTAEKTEILRQDVANLEAEVRARQEMIKELTQQLSEANDKNASYHTKILEEADTSARVRQFISGLQNDVFNANQKLLLAQCTQEKYELYADESQNSALVVSFMTTRWHKQCVDHTHSFGELQAELGDAEAALQRAAQDAATQAEALVVAEARIAELASLVHEKDGALRAHLETAAAAATELSNKEQLIEELNVLLREANVNLTALRAEVEEAQNREQNGGVLAAQRAQLNNRFSTWLIDAEENMVSSLACKSELLCIVCVELVNSARESVDLHLSQKESLERRCRELEQFVKETKAALLHKDVALAEKESTQEEKISSLQGVVNALQKEKKQISFQLTSLLSRFEEEREAFEELKKKMDSDGKAAAAARGSLEVEVAKLRKGVEYELQRKCEYKDALEKLRKLRDESESLRAKEKDLAVEAIAEANAEATYWIDAFDRLKRMIDGTKHGEHSVPSIDAETVSRLESVKSRFLGPIRPQDVNNGKPQPVLKRRRVDEA